MTLRWALGVTLLSAVADRFGLWGLPGVVNISWGNWPRFVAYTAKVNSFLPAVFFKKAAGNRLADVSAGLATDASAGICRGRIP